MSRLRLFAKGVRVIDLSAFLPGPLASLLLADMGADVLKVEPPSGDMMAQIGPRDAAGRPVFYGAVNAGKTLRRMDLKQPEIRREFLQLVANADVLIEGFRPGVMQRLGLDYLVLREVNPGLVYCSLSGYGAEGPMAQVAGHDANYLALSGILHRNGAAAPAYYDPPLADSAGSLFGVIAILGALRARDADGLGSRIDIGLADAAMPLQLFPIAEHGVTGAVPERGGGFLNGAAAYYQVYALKDGRHVMLGAVEPKFWTAFCTAAGHPEWVARQQEPLPQHALIAEVADAMAAMTLDDCLARFGAADCCLSPVLDLREALASPHHATRGVVRQGPAGDSQVLFPAHVDGESPRPRPPLRRDAGSDRPKHFQDKERACPT
ncbi:CaiB/BaiF CoA transferase family protein [Roseomonas marmotae]|uniref:CoA transferase n=1 Tax=Roseomonas marmotae TaxID=2768161 RepID=A0ABS3KIQ9_9PROT|nr:CoA transferase [Roseomonas marmotae]MBO1076907.1 CoA transferase [Roseomonas marmotae]